MNTHYTLEHGSTHVKLKGSYVSTLPVGTHTMTISVTGYEAISQNFTITATPVPSSKSKTKYAVPKTGVE